MNRFFGRIQNTSLSSWRAAGKLALGFQGFYEREHACDASYKVDCTYLSSHAISYNLAQSRIQHACAAEYMHDDTGL